MPQESLFKGNPRAHLCKGRVPPPFSIYRCVRWDFLSRVIPEVCILLLCPELRPRLVVLKNQSPEAQSGRDLTPQDNLLGDAYRYY